MDINITEFVTFFVVSFFFGLTFRLIYGRASGSMRRPTKVQRPVKNVRYISPKVNEDTAETHGDGLSRPDKDVVNR